MRRDWSRSYGSAEFRLYVTYHRRVGGRLRQITISPKLLAKVLRR